MAKANTGPKLVLYGPDTRHGATPKRGFSAYVYYIRWYEGGAKRERSTGTGDVREAQGALAALIGELSAASAPAATQRSAAASAMSVAEMLGLYLEHHAPHAAAPDRIRYAIRNLVPWWDGKAVADITAGTCRDYAASAPRALATIRRELGTLAAAMNWCLAEGWLAQGGTVALPAVPKDEQPFLSRSQAARLLWSSWRRRWRWKDPHGVLHTNIHLPLFILIGLYQGARKEAILSLQWQPNTEGGYVDLDRGFIDFNPLGRAQSKKRRSRVPIATRLLPWLRIARRITRQFVVECDGKPLGDIKRSFASAASAIGMPEIHPHTLRHTCVTWLLWDGLSYWDVGGYVGMSPQTVEQVYGHHSLDHMSEAANSARGKGKGYAGMKAGIKGGSLGRPKP